MEGWSEERHMAHYSSEREQYYEGLGLDPDTCTMDVTHADAIQPEPDVDGRPTPPPTLTMGADGLPADYFDW